jgi:hypothetical protein
MRLLDHVCSNGALEGGGTCPDIDSHTSVVPRVANRQVSTPPGRGALSPLSAESMTKKAQKGAGEHGGEECRISCSEAHLRRRAAGIGGQNEIFGHTKALKMGAQRNAVTGSNLSEEHTLPRRREAERGEPSGRGPLRISSA